MVKKQALTISIVIPAYNEEGYLKACLQSIANQTEQPDEVIVVDNNSTDKTAEIAHSFAFVTVINESRQGQAFAQVAGFDKATGNIIGRIDADSILPEDWVAQVTAIFINYPQMAAFTGAPLPYDVPYPKLAVWAFQLYHDWATRWIAGHSLMYGTNCGFRGELWPLIKQQINLRNDIWEDYELGFLLAKHGTIVWRPAIVVGCSFRKFAEPYFFQIRYHWQAVRTFSLHANWSRTFLQGLLRSTIVFCWPFMMINRRRVRQ